MISLFLVSFIRITKARYAFAFIYIDTSIRKKGDKHLFIFESFSKFPFK